MHKEHYKNTRPDLSTSGGSAPPAQHVVHVRSAVVVLCVLRCRHDFQRTGCCGPPSPAGAEHDAALSGLDDGVRPFSLAEDTLVRENLSGPSTSVIRRALRRLRPCAFGSRWLVMGLAREPGSSAVRLNLRAVEVENEMTRCRVESQTCFQPPD
jgi:hypothetical protein